MALSIFPEEMMGTPSSPSAMSLDGIAAKFSYFHEQLHLLHWQTTSYAEHQALGGLYDKVADLKDDVVEKIMGYTGTRPRAFKIEQLKDYSIGIPKQIVTELKSFASSLETYGKMNNMPDIENIAQGLSGDAAKTLYLLTLS